MSDHQPAPQSKPRIPRQRDTSDAETTHKEDPATGRAVPGMARYLIDPAIEAEIQAFIASAPPLPEEKRARLARLLRTNHCRDQPT